MMQLYNNRNFVSSGFHIFDEFSIKFFTFFPAARKTPSANHAKPPGNYPLYSIAHDLFFFHPPPMAVQRVRFQKTQLFRRGVLWGGGMGGAHNDGGARRGLRRGGPRITQICADFGDWWLRGFAEG
jgi:hypothetical protein